MSVTGRRISLISKLVRTTEFKGNIREWPTKELTGIERTMRALNFEETDRIPIVGGFVRHPEFLAEVAGVPLSIFWKNPRKIAIEAFKKLGADLILGLSYPTVGFENHCATGSISIYKRRLNELKKRPLW